MKMWIARDPNGNLWCYEIKPQWYEGLREWGCMIGDKHFKMDCTLFPNVTFENSPMEVELKLIK